MVLPTENNTDYEVTVFTTQKQMQVTHTFRISEGLLVPSASHLRGHVINPTTVRLEWTPSVRHPHILGYKVCFRELPASVPLTDRCLDR